MLSARDMQRQARSAHLSAQAHLRPITPLHRLEVGASGADASGLPPLHCRAYTLLRSRNRARLYCEACTRLSSQREPCPSSFSEAMGCSVPEPNHGCTGLPPGHAGCASLPCSALHHITPRSAGFVCAAAHSQPCAPPRSAGSHMAHGSAARTSLETDLLGMQATVQAGLAAHLLQARHKHGVVLVHQRPSLLALKVAWRQSRHPFNLAKLACQQMRAAAPLHPAAVIWQDAPSYLVTGRTLACVNNQVNLVATRCTMALTGKAESC